MKKKIHLLLKDPYFITAFFLFIIGAFIRFYRIEPFITYLGDQGRDAIIIKRIITLEHFPAIGPTTSVGQVFLGPFYYYFIAPWLLLSNFHPVGLAVGVAFFSSLYIFITYFGLADLLDKKTAIVTIFLITFSKILIDLSRFSWNPNLLPLFAFLTAYLLLKGLKTNKSYFYALFGFFLSFCIQLHYLAFFLIPALGIVVLIHFKEHWEKRIILFKKFIISFLFFVIGSLPLILFDLRHNFINIKNLVNLTQKTSGVEINRVQNFIDTFYTLNRFSFNVEFSHLLSLISLITICLIAIIVVWKKNSFRNFLLLFVISLVGLSLYPGPKYMHYFAFIYPFYYIIIGYFISRLSSLSRVGYTFIGIFFVGYLYFAVLGYSFFYLEPNRQIEWSQKIAQSIYNHVSVQPYRLTSLPEKYNDMTYRYFLELSGRRPLPEDSLEKGEELIVVCEKDCSPNPIGDRHWDIALFAPKKVISSWKVDDVTIYRLSR